MHGAMRTLGIDYGSRRVGLAVSDPLGITAQPIGHFAWGSRDDLAALIRRTIRERDVSLIVVGLPVSMKGTLGPAAVRVLEFVEWLAAECPVPVKTWDERLTTAEAERILIDAGMRRGRRKTRIDQVAAQLMLQNYLDATQHRADDDG